MTATNAQLWAIGAVLYKKANCSFSRAGKYAKLAEGKKLDINQADKIIKRISAAPEKYNFGNDEEINTNLFEEVLTEDKK